MDDYAAHRTALPSRTDNLNRNPPQLPGTSMPARRELLLAYIYQPAPSPTQSGRARSEWMLEFEQTEPPETDPLTGWIGSQDPFPHIRLRFPRPGERDRVRRPSGLALRGARSADPTLSAEELRRQLPIRPGGRGRLRAAAMGRLGLDFRSPAAGGSGSVGPGLSDWGERVGEIHAAAKVPVESGSRRIVGAHLLGPDASELIDLFGLAMRTGLRARDLKSWSVPICRPGPRWAICCSRRQSESRRRADTDHGAPEPPPHN